MLVLIAITAILLVIGYVNDNAICKTVGWILVILINLFASIIEKSLGKISAKIKAKVDEKKNNENNDDGNNGGTDFENDAENDVEYGTIYID